MSDLISRQDAIKAIRRLQTYMLCEGDDTFLIDKADVQTELMMLPSADLWIPCSERLPEYGVDMFDDGVIVTATGRVGNTFYENAIITDADFEDGEWYIYGVKQEHLKVLAWMPLPEPWKGGEA